MHKYIYAVNTGISFNYYSFFYIYYLYVIERSQKFTVLRKIKYTNVKYNNKVIKFKMSMKYIINQYIYAKFMRMAYVLDSILYIVLFLIIYIYKLYYIIM